CPRATAAEQRFEEREHARLLRLRHRAALARACDLLLALALLRRFDHAALALDRRQRAAVDIVDVAADLQFAGIVDERGLISEVHPDRYRQLDVLLARAEHVLDPVRRPVLAR